VIDLCGTKRNICRGGAALAEQYGFTFVGGHPMAGTQYSGIKHSKATLFKNAPMVLVPHVYDDIYFLARIKQLLAPAMFGRITVTTAEEHDIMIAFTSQLAHVVSNAYVKSPTAQYHKGFSAGSYKDMTRVAWLNENMWTELFLENKEPLIYEIDTIINSLSAYRDAINDGDADKLRSLLKDGRIAKEKIDG
jgi:prephenate dehydrogenase